MKQYTRLADIQHDLTSGAVTCRQLVEYYLQKIKETEQLNAFVEVYEQEALQRAEALDKKIGTGKLFGLVIGLKDVICYRGHKVTASSHILDDFESLYDATATKRLLDEDAIIIGRLNCDEFAMGSSNENSYYGPVKNVLDETKVPGGSSGGSAVAVQAGLCHATLGTDTGGSIRQPASFCGIVGLKPTYGRVSRYGLIAYASSFDQIGTFTHSVEDAALILEVIAGKDGYDSTAASAEVGAYSQLLQQDKKPRIAYFKDALQHDGLDENIRQQTEGFIEKLQADGCVVEGVDFPYLDYIVPAYYVLTTAEASSNLARFDGVHYGYRSPNAEDMETVYTRTRTEGFGKEVQRRIMLGTFVLSAGYYDAYYSKAQKVRRIIRDTMRKMLAEYDFIMMPTTPTTAYKIGEKIKDPIAMYLGDIYTVQANLAGLPGVSLPMFTHPDGMPFGIQVISDKFEEGKLLAFSKYLLDNKAQFSS